MKTLDWTVIRNEFPTLAHWIYLDSARKTIPPRCQEQAVAEYYLNVYEKAGADAWSELNVAQARVELARLLGADSREIAFTKNTTEGLNIAAHAFDLKPGDNIVLTNMEHIANVWVWKHWEGKGVEIRYAQNRDGRLPLQAFLEKCDGRTRVISTAYVTYSNGYRVNLPELSAACRERDIKLVVDGAQAVGILSAPLAELGAHIIAIAGHKGLLGLSGSGIVYCREELVDTVLTPFINEPETSGPTKTGGHISNQFDYVCAAHRFESGNPNFLGIHAFRRAAQLIQSIGLQAVEARARDLSTYCLRLIKQAGLKTMTPDRWDERAQIVNVLASDAEAVMNRLREKHRIVVNVKDGALRISMNFYNNEEDLEKAVHAIVCEMNGNAAVRA